MLEYAHMLRDRALMVNPVKVRPALKLKNTSRIIKAMAEALEMWMSIEVNNRPYYKVVVWPIYYGSAWIIVSANLFDINSTHFNA